jgi:rod shape-determining protein MreD
MRLGNISYTQILTALLILLFFVGFQSLFAEIFTFKGIKFDLAILLVVGMGLFKGPTYGAVFGFLIGFLLDLFLPQFLGLNALIKTILGYLAGNFKDNLYLETVFSKGIIVMLALWINDFFYYLISESFRFSLVFSTWFNYSLLSSIYTALLAVIVFSLREKRFSSREKRE